MEWEDMIHGNITNFMHLNPKINAEKLNFFYPKHSYFFSKPGIYLYPHATQSDEEQLY